MNKTSLRLLVSNDECGKLLGKHGHRIESLRTAENTVILDRNYESPERIVFIECYEIETICEIVGEMMSNYNIGKRGKVWRLKMLIDQSQAGSIIGTGGEVINNIINSLNYFHIHIFCDCAPKSTEKIVRIKGVCLNDVLMILKNILVICNKNPILGFIHKPYCTKNYDGRLAMRYGGYTVFEEEKVYSRPNAADQRKTKESAECSAKQQYSSVDAVVDDKELDESDKEINLMEMEFGSVVSSKVTIPKRLAGVICDKRLKDIKKESGADIVVNPPQMNKNEQIVSFSGLKFQIEAAQFLLQQYLCSSLESYNC